MGIFDKVMFWKHDMPDPSPDIGALPQESGLPMGQGIGGPLDQGGSSITERGMQNIGASGLGGMGDTTAGFGAQPTMGGPTGPPGGYEPVEPHAAPSSFGQPQPIPQGSETYALSKNIEVISSKIDALRAVLESLNQRIEHIEKIAEGEAEAHHKQAW